jgi:glutamate racemase
MSPNSPIAILDSGLGGLTVVKAVHELLPHECIVYFGDTARLPYGSKSAATVTSFVRQIINFLRPQNPKHVVIACNTATALALPAIRAEFAPALSITGVVEPGARAAVNAAGAKPVPIIGVIATEATIRSKAYDRAIHRRRHHARLLLQPTPLLVPIIEEGRTAADPLVKLALSQYLMPMLERKPDVMVLGCTHYPILKEAIQQMCGGAVNVIDSAQQCAEDVARRLRSVGLLRPMDSPADRSSAASVVPIAKASSSPRGTRTRAQWLRCFVTDDSPRFRRLASHFLGAEVEAPTWVAPEQLYDDPQRAIPDDDAPPVRRAV